MRRRLAQLMGVALVATVVALAAVTPANAKIQWFTVRWSPEAPVAGQAVEVTVRFWENATHAQRAHWPSHSIFREFLWAFAEGSSVVAPHDAIPIDVRSIRRGVMRGQIVFPSAGEWTLCTWSPQCAEESDVPGNPGRMRVMVSGGIPPVTTTAIREAAAVPPARSSVAPVVTAALAGVLLAGALGVRRSRHP